MKNIDYDVFEITVYIVCIFSLIISVAKCSNDHDKKEWNNGYCECGGQYEYEQAVGHQFRTSYIYKCDNCGRRIEVWEER